MHRKTLFIFLFLPLFQVVGQTMDLSSEIWTLSSSNFVRVNYENDLLAGTDKDYTQGFSVQFGSNRLNEKFQGFWKRGLFTNPTLTSISLDNYVYTPENIQTEKIQNMDRPYSANFQVGIRKVREISNSRWRMSKHTFIGCQGPIALGKEIQTGIHQATGDPLPKGWLNQMENQIIFGYKLRVENALIRTSFIDLNGLVQGQLSNWKSFASFGGELLLGRLKYWESDRKGAKICLYSQAWMHAVFYDASLQGRPLGDKSPFTYDKKDVNWWVGECHVGLVLEHFGFQMGFDLGLKTKDYRYGQMHRWAALKLSYAWE